MEETKRFHPKDLKFIILLFISTRIVTWFLGYYAFKILYPINKDRYLFDNNEEVVFDIWSVWDSGWYLEIAQNGYSPEIHTDSNTSNQANFAFYPLYPISMRLLGNVIGSNIIAGLIISNVSLFISSLFLFMLVRDEYNENIAKNSLLFLYAFPSAFVFTSVYSESLFLMLTVSSYYFFRKNKYLLSGILGGFSSLTRNVGVLLMAPFTVELLKKSMSLKDKICHFIKLLFIPLGSFIFMLFIRYLTGDLFSMIKIQKGWGREFNNPIKFLLGGFVSDDYQHRFTAVFSVMIIILVLFLINSLRESYWIYSLLLFIVPFSTGLESLPRYILVSFPIFIFFGIVRERYTKFSDVLLILFSMIQGMMLVFWTAGFNLLV